MENIADLSNYRNKKVLFDEINEHSDYLHQQAQKGGAIYDVEQGIAMLSSVLRSKKALQVNVAIIRAFVRMRQLLTETDDLRVAIESMKNEYDEKFDIIF